MSVLVAKILLAPTFVVGASLIARRFGASIGGLVGGLPVVAGPILLVFALDHGSTFAAQAATGTILGIVSLATFIVVYARLASRARWSVSLVAGWIAFFAMTALLSATSLGAGASLAVALAWLVLAFVALPSVDRERSEAVRLPAWDLPLRAASALTLVLALTALADQLGPKLSGLLAPFPVIASVLAVFTHAQHGKQEVLRIMRGFLVGLVAYAFFFFTLSLSLESLGIAAAFLLATAIALTTQTVALVVLWRWTIQRAAVQAR